MVRPWFLPLLTMLWLSAPESVLCGNFDSVNVTIPVSVDGDIVPITLPEHAIHSLGDVLSQLFAHTRPNASFEILTCDSPHRIECPENSNCIELSRNSAAFTCVCASGYVKNGTDCIVDPCLGNCNYTEICEIDTGTCKCADGFAENSGICDKVDTPCFGHNCPAHSVCKEVDDATFTCECNGNGGYEDAGSGDDGQLICEDVNECERQPTVCSSNANCTNIEGSYSCECNPGFVGDGKICNDTDECAEGIDLCHVLAICENTEGSYNCICTDGYSGDGNHCEDIIECEDNNGGCHIPNGNCQNTIGSFLCSCKDGYTGDGQPSCTDIDECMEPDICHSKQTCVNTDGSFNCQLFVGIVIDITSAARRKRNIPSTLDNDLEEYLENILSTNIDITITAHEPITVSLDADPSYKEAIESLLHGLTGVSIRGYTINSLTYPTDIYFSGKVPSTAADETEACQSIVDHIENDPSIDPAATVTCDGTLDGGELSFNIKVEGEDSDFDIASVLANSALNVTQDPCVCDVETSECTFVNGLPRCTCNTSRHDADFTNPGNVCVNPISEVICGTNDIGAKLYASYFYRIGLTPESLHLFNMSCVGSVQGEWLIFNSLATECGTITNHTGEKVQYENAVTNMYFPGAIEKANPTINFAISCCYPTNFTSPTTDDDAVRIGVVTATVITQNAQGTGTLILNVTIYRDSAFTTPLLSDESIAPGTTLYVLAEHSAAVQPNYLKLTSCTATPDKERVSDDHLDLITNSCPNNAVEVTMLKSGVEQNASFAFGSFKFPNSDDFYLHCDVTLCDEPCVETCASGTRRRRRAASGGIDVTVGPISFTKASDAGISESDTPSSPSSDSAGGSAGAGGAVGAVVACLAAVAIVVLIVWKRKQMRSSKYSDSNVPSASYYNSGFSTQTTEYADCPSRISRRN